MRKAEKDLESLAEFAIDEAKNAGADFLTFIGGHSRSVRDRVVGGQVLQPKDSEEKWSQLVLWRNGRVKTDNVYPKQDQIRSAIGKMLNIIQREEFPPSDLIPPEGPHKGGYDARLAKNAYDAETAKLSSESAAKIILTAKHLLAKESLVLDGVLTQSLGTVLIATTHGTRQAHTSTSSGFSLYVFDRNEAENLGEARLVSAFSYSGGESIRDISASAMSEEAIIKCNLQRVAGKRLSRWNPFEKFPNFTGERYFDVILEPPFIGPILTWLFGYGGFNGKFYLQGESFLSGKMGEKVFGENITIWDDPFNPKGIVNPFDWEGVPKRKLCLVNRGVLERVCYDTTLAKIAGVKSTGHALPASYAMAFGTAPENIYVEGGPCSIKQMIQDSTDFSSSP